MIQYSDIRKIRPIAENMIDEKRLLPYMNEVERLELIPAFGALLYKKIEDNPDQYKVLFNGGYYNDGSAYFAGLSEACGYLVYSRFVQNQNVNVTAFGVVQKVSQYSEPMDEKTIVRVSNEARNIGVEYLNQCLCYLRFIGEIQDGCCMGEKKVKSIKIRAI